MGTSTWTWQPTDQRVTTDVDGRDLGSIRRTAGRPGAIYANTSVSAGRPITRAVACIRVQLATARRRTVNRNVCRWNYRHRSPVDTGRCSE